MIEIATLIDFASEGTVADGRAACRRNDQRINRITLSTDASTSDDYSLSDVLPTVNNVRDLGVLVDSRLTFHDHTNSIVSRGHIRAMQIWRCFLCKDVSNLIRAFTVYVRPMMEYCSSLWSPVNQKFTTCKPARICPTAVY